MVEEELKDKELVCVDCKTPFVFSVGEQTFFASKGLTNEPKRCLDCRKAKKAKNERVSQPVRPGDVPYRESGRG